MSSTNHWGEKKSRKDGGPEGLMSKLLEVQFSPKQSPLVGWSEDRWIKDSQKMLPIGEPFGSEWTSWDKLLVCWRGFGYSN